MNKNIRQMLALATLLSLFAGGLTAKASAQAAPVDEPKKEEPKQEAPKQEPKKEEPKKEEPKPAAPKDDTSGK